MATKQQQKDFIEKIWQAIAGLDLNGLFPSVLIAQAGLESSWGTSSLTSKYNNAFGVKAGKSWTGKTVTLPTKEYRNGQYVSVMGTFRVYDSLAESIADRNKLFDLNIYKKQGVRQAQTPEAQIKAIAAAGYATDANYVSKILNTIKSNNLTIYDEKKKEIMNTKTISIMIIAMAAIMAGVGIYNLIKL